MAPSILDTSVYECVGEWVNVTSGVKRFERSVGWKSAVEKVCLPYFKTSYV